MLPKRGAFVRARTEVNLCVCTCVPLLMHVCLLSCWHGPCLQEELLCVHGVAVQFVSLPLLLYLLLFYNCAVTVWRWWYRFVCSCTRVELSESCRSGKRSHFLVFFSSCDSKSMGNSIVFNGFSDNLKRRRQEVLEP